MKHLIKTTLLALPMGLASAGAWAADYKSDKEQFSYAIGYQIGQTLKRDGLDVDSKALGQAIDDVLKGGKLKLTTDEMQAAMQKYQSKREQEMVAASTANKKKGSDFLAANKGKPGVTQTASGLQYKVLTPGTGKKPTADSTVVAHYRGTLIDGTEFDSSHKRGEPATFPVKGVIPGWQEVLPLMSQGAKYQVFIPSDLAYGDRGAGGQIGPNETLIFEIELIEVK